MSQTPTRDPANPESAPAHGAHDPNLAHHFDTPQQQFEAGKLGMWLFLTTEVLLFSGLFCAYAVYRANHPEIFLYAHQWLDTNLGALNTAVLIFSSFTMAWAVRAAQMGQRKLLVVLLGITLLCGFGFLGVKFVEYNHKIHDGLLWGKYYNPHAPPGGNHAATATAGGTVNQTQPGNAAGSGLATVGGVQVEESKIPPAARGPEGISPAWLARESHHAYVAHPEPEPYNVQTFFSIYYLMTGLHGLHVIAGMALIAWIMIRAAKGHFGPNYYNPVDYTGLYWHLVDLIWIFLFPLLYLIR